MTPGSLQPQTELNLYFMSQYNVTLTSNVYSIVIKIKQKSQSCYLSMKNEEKFGSHHDLLYLELHKYKVFSTL